MLFNSVDFVIFLPIVFILFWFFGRENLSRQNFVVVASSLFFYGFWDWRFLFLMLFSAVVDFYISLAIVRQDRSAVKKRLLVLSLILNLGLLGFFKYYNFFATSFSEAFTFFGFHFDPFTLDIILPVGISFYTFQTLSYTIDVYRGSLKPSEKLIPYISFVTFFPQLVAGPIERASNLLPQFYNARKFDYKQATDGMRQILWGLFKKVVVADNCAEYVNLVFSGAENYDGSTLLIGVFLFAIQIYGDFSGYSDIAIGTARLFGVQLMQNFAFPYFSRDIAEFWRRWHISLSTWFRDYLYFPLGGSKVILIKQIRNIFVIFLVSGFWHGASWNFLFWGGINAAFFLPLLLSQKNRVNIDIVAKGKYLPTALELFWIILTFFQVILGWVFFRAVDLNQAFYFYGKIFSFSVFYAPADFLIEAEILVLIIILLFFFVIEWMGREGRFAIEHIDRKLNQGFRWSFYLIIALFIAIFMGDKNSFIYFQF